MISNVTHITVMSVAQNRERLNRFLSMLEQDLENKTNYPDVKIQNIQIDEDVTVDITKRFKVSFILNLEKEDYLSIGDTPEKVKDAFIYGKLKDMDYQQTLFEDFEIEEIK